MASPHTATAQLDPAPMQTQGSIDNMAEEINNSAAIDPSTILDVSTPSGLTVKLKAALNDGTIVNMLPAKIEGIKNIMIRILCKHAWAMWIDHRAMKNKFRSWYIHTQSVQ